MGISIIPTYLLKFRGLKNGGASYFWSEEGVYESRYDVSTALSLNKLTKAVEQANTRKTQQIKARHWEEVIELEVEEKQKKRWRIFDRGEIK